MSEDLRRHRLRELGAASRTELPHALRSDLAVETEHLSLEGNCGGDRPQKLRIEEIAEVSRHGTRAGT